MKDFAMSFQEQYKVTILTEYRDVNFRRLYPSEIRYLHYHPANLLGSVKGLRRINELIRWIYFKITFLRLGIKSYDIAIAMKEGTVSKYISKLRAGVRLGWIHVDYDNAFWTKQVYHSSQEELECMKAFRYIICVSEQIKTSILHVIGDPGNLLVRYNPIDVSRIVRLAKDGKDFDQLPDTDTTRFIAIGRLHKQKGFDLLLQACSMLEQEGISYELWIIGSGNEENKLKTFVTINGIKHVKLLGEMDNPYIYLKHADWFVLSSRYEGYSIVTQEAAVLGIPIIATDCAGVRELLGEAGEHGIIVNINAEEIYKAMKLVITKPKLHSVYQEKIKERAQEINYEFRMARITELFHS